MSEVYYIPADGVDSMIWKTSLLTVYQVLYTVKPLYTDIRYNSRIRYNDNLNGTIP